MLVKNVLLMVTKKCIFVNGFASKSSAEPQKKACHNALSQSLQWLMAAFQKARRTGLSEPGQAKTIFFLIAEINYDYIKNYGFVKSFDKKDSFCAEMWCHFKRFWLI